MPLKNCSQRLDLSGMSIFLRILKQGRFSFGLAISSLKVALLSTSHEFSAFCRLSKGFSFVKFTCKQDAENVCSVP